MEFPSSVLGGLTVAGDAKQVSDAAFKALLEFALQVARKDPAVSTASVLGSFSPSVCLSVWGFFLVF